MRVIPRGAKNGKNSPKNAVIGFLLSLMHKTSHSSGFSFWLLSFGVDGVGKAHRGVHLGHGPISDMPEGQKRAKTAQYRL